MRSHPYLDGPHPRAYAHRGWHIGDLAGLENTFAAFRRAVDEGFCYLELDVRASADGVPFVHHDGTLDRMTDGRGPIAAHPAATLRKVKVRGREPIPPLEQVLTELPDTTRITIELKSDAVVGPVLETLERTDSWHRVCLGGFSERWLARARAMGGTRLFTSMAQRDALALRSRAWLDGAPCPLKLLPAPPVAGHLAQLPHRFGVLTVVDAALVRAAHTSGREVHVWTINNSEEMTALLDLGVDGILTDRPDLLREVLRLRGEWRTDPCPS